MTAPSLRIAHLTDLHLTDGPHLVDQAEVLNGAADQCEELGVGASLLTGDLYGRAVPHRSTPRERAVLYPLVQRLARLGPVVIVPGNHDYPGDLDTLATISGGSGWPVVVASGPEVVTLETSGADLQVYALPWLTTRLLLQGESMPRGIEAQRLAASHNLDGLLGHWASRIRESRGANPDAVHVLAAHCMVAGGRTSGGEVLSGREIEVSRAALEAMGLDYGALGHLHFAQEAADRVWYGGDPYPVDFGEVESKTWSLIDVGGEQGRIIEGAQTMDYPRADGRPLTSVHRLPTGHRRWITLDYEWGIDDRSDVQRWVTLPTPEQFAATAEANVRARLTVSADHRKSCPWEQSMRTLSDRGAIGADAPPHSIKSEVNTIPVHRVRAPEVAEAATLEEKCEAYWGSLDVAPEDADQATALGLLAELRSTTDEAIHAATAALMPRTDR